MAIYTDSKEGLGVVESAWRRTEPLLTPGQLVSRYLVGIPLMSGTKNPDTGKPDRITPAMLTDYIEGAMSDAETMCHIELMPAQIDERHPFDPQEFQSQGYLRLKHRPVASVESVAIAVSSGESIFTFNNEWIETGNLDQGQLNIMPLLLMLRKGGQDGQGTTAMGTGNQYLTVFGSNQWKGAILTVKYTVGYKDGNMPRPINNLIGTIAAMKVLSILAPTYARSQGSSLSIGGMSQSVSTPGPELFKLRLEELEKDRDMLIRKIKKTVGQTLFSGNV